MRITVKLGEIEVTIDRPKIRESDTVTGDIRMTKEVVFTTLELVVEKVLSLQNGNNRST